ncbi:MAG: hypothetical protein K2O18_12300 [Oscillospiraceae bacterium]|nr:hypothetical protein [Oscillospiraceae bacterium]
MGSFTWIFVAVLIAMSVFSIIFCCFRGRGASHKKLVFFASLLSVMVLVCFGGNAILSIFDMGWRCTPFNNMLLLCSVLFIPTLWYGMKEFIVLKDTNHILIGTGFISMLLVLIMIPVVLFFYFLFFSWHDGLTAYNDQTIVYANDMHGGSCSWRYYTHINSLVHGIEITQDGWWGHPPQKIF